ncbi:nucleotidyl transferase AbiEii/AbiGii toxin family protein [Amycolatopsis nigrescens]|uniref:nucleotidyl transferase AbiEii/AbiGii toxin family protein n=1 Tax=Amycolatopsis nigrescens TaxID=381445 RepID=UPI00037E4824|nr:nucleotidyl transferase AbiEii/AbiGii toxin family protein [Amycolatopsis nigrescens]
MPDPSRDTIAGAVFQDLRNLARRQRRGTDELLVFYVLERFLYRLSRSPYADRFTLKGGLLLATLDARRPTRDGDLLAELTRDESSVLDGISAIARIEDDDGVEFLAEEIKSTTIREGDLYEGLRVSMPARVATARVKLQLDINFGDPVTPGAIVTEYPQLLAAGAFRIQGYPLETVLAEKLTTAMSLGDANTRDRDWADLWRLTGQHELSDSAVYRALERTAAHRGVELRPLSHAITSLPTRRAGAFRAWRTRQGVDGAEYPEAFADLVADVVAFADHLMTEDIGRRTWDPVERRWTATPGV